MSSGQPPDEKLRVLWRSRLGAENARGYGRDTLPLELIVETDADRALEHRDWAQILVDGNPSAELLDGAGLRHLIVPYAGVAADVSEALLQRPHLGLWNSHFNAAFVAQHAVALLLACSNRISEGDRALRRGDWGPRYDDDFTSLQLDGKVALLLGYGAVGREVEKRVRGLGMEVAILRRRVAVEQGGVRQYGPDQLHEALQAAHAVMVSLPGTEATKGLLDAAALASMREDAVLVNVGRGDVVDAPALYQALSQGRLRGAGLDVWWRYPADEQSRSATFPAEPPLHELPNVVMSPHRANQADDWETAAFRDGLETLRSLAAGGNRNRVDPRHGY